MPGVTITAPLPEVGVTVGPTWASLLIAWCNEVEADIEATIQFSAITIAQDVEFNNYKAIELNGVKFTSKSAAAASSGIGSSNMLEVVGGDLHFINGNGASIKITSGGTLNLSTAGGFTGDYIFTNAECHFSLSQDRYTFTDDNAKPAKINSGQIQLRHETAGSHPIVIQSPAALASGYNWVLPDGVGTDTKTEWIVGTTVGSTVTLDTSSSINVLATLAEGARFKSTGSGDGSSVLSWYETAGLSGTKAADDGTLGWIPVIVHAGLASQTAWSIYYVTRYAWLQKIDDWVTLFAHIQFSVTWTSGGGTSAWSPITISGIPYKAWAGVSGMPVIAAATAYGEVYEFPRTEIYDASDADRMHHPDAGSFGGTDTHWPANDSTLKCFMLENEDILRFYPTTIAESGPTYPAGRMVAQAFNVNGTGPALISSNRVTVNFEKETSGTPTVAASLDKIYTVAFKIQYRAL